MIGIAHKKMAFPIAWSALPSGGGSSADAHIDVLERFLSVVDPAAIEVVMADREFISVKWLKRLQELKIPFNIRFRSDRRLGLSTTGPALPVRMHARSESVGNERVLDWQRYLFGTEEHAPVAVRVVVRRLASASSRASDKFLILATSGIDPEQATSLYRRRWEIETMFAALKSRGFKLEKTHLTAPGRVERLIGLLALTYAWTRLIGQKRAGRHGPPARKVHGRRERSLFRYGLDWLQSILTTPEPQPIAFFTCLSGLRSPTLFLSCT